jgi:hypothetical protein
MTDEPKRDDPTDFSQFRKPARKVDLTVVDSAKESLGYSASPKLSQAPAPPQRRLFKTGRNVQFNVKASAETVRRFVAICDAYGTTNRPRERLRTIHTPLPPQGSPCASAGYAR